MKVTNLRNSYNAIGRVSNDPEFKTVSEKSTVVKFSIAVSDPFKNDKGEWEDDTDFFYCELWNPSEHTRSFLLKGNEIMIGGRMKTSTYEKDGNKITRNFLRVNEIFLTKKKSEAQNEAIQQVEEQQA